MQERHNLTLDREPETRSLQSRLRRILSSSVSTAVLLWLMTPGFAQQLPTGGVVSAGSASFARPNVSTLNINQSSNQAIINWQSFSAGTGSTINFNQPGSSSATLNRVLGSTPSSIAGTINAPGTVLLVNPNGIAITRSGVINTGSFAASTLDIKDSDFLAGRYKFSGTGGSAAVTNSGRINVSDGGFAALLGGQVANDGVISARLGKVGLGAGEAATLDLSGDGFLAVTVPSSELGKLVNPDRALISNKGRINADGGTVYLSAATAANVLRNAVNIPGSVRANTVGSHNGRIVINGGAGGTVRISGRLAASGKHGKAGSISVSGARVHVSGTISATGAKAGAVKVTATDKLTLSGKIAATASADKGGTIDLTAANARLLGALIDASGSTGGGVVQIGGGLHGSGSLAHALNVSIDTASTVRADAINSGSGGTIAVWSDGNTTASGTFSARGGANSGDGGTIETSGHSVDFTGIRVNASAANGAAGTWLVDPNNLTVDSAAATTITNTLISGTNVTLQTNADGTTNGPGAPSNGAGNIVFAAPIFASGGSSSSATLTVQAYNDVVINGGGTYISTASSFVAQAGGTFLLNGSLIVRNLSVTTQRDMTFNGDLTVNGTSTLAAGGNITLSGNTNNLGFTPVLNAGGNIQILTPTSMAQGATINAYGSINIAANLTNFGNFGAGSITLRADSDGNGSGTVNFTNGAQLAAGGAPVTIYYNPTSYTSPTNFSSNITGASSVTPYMLVTNVGQLEAITNAPSGTYALGRDIDASGVNFVPIGWNGTAHNFTGLFDGQGHVINNLTIGVLGSSQMPDRSFNNQAGLFWENDGTIRNLGVTGSIWTTYNTWVGGLAGAVGSTGVITNSWSSVSVTAGNSYAYAGGLVGVNLGHITGGSYATGSVTANGNYAGGLVGQNAPGGVIDNSYASGDVNGQYAGGLVGWNRYNGLINYTYALGSVHGSGYTGGLVGVNEQIIGSGGPAYGVIMNSYAAGHLTGNTIGGIAGLNGWDPSENQDNFNAQIGQSGKVWWSTWDATTTGTYKAFGSSYLDRSGYSSENVQFIGYTGTAACSASCPNGGGYLGSSYQTSSYSYFNDPTPGSTNMQATGFAAHWYMVDGATRPFLSAEYSTTIQNSHQLQLIDMNGGANYTLARDITYSNDGMWTAAGFSPIAPVTALNVETKVYGIFSLTNFGFTQSQTQSGNDVIKTIIFSGASYPVAQTLLSDTYAVSYQPTSFSGTLNGNGHTISNLTESITSGNAGLFETIGSGATVQNLGLVNPQINVDNHSIATGSAGSLAGFNSGTIYNVWATGGQVNTWFATDVGGLVGLNTGLITQSYANVGVTGVNQFYDTVNNNWTSTFYDHDGGLVGTNYGQITNTYALGFVSGNGSVGGLVGYNGGTIGNSYTTGQTGNNYNYGINAVGALVGNNQGNVFSSFWDSTVATNKIGAGTGRTTDQLQDLNTFAATYTGWDFNHVWAPPNLANQGGLSASYYPQLYANTAVIFVQPSAASMTYGQAAPSLSTSVAGGPSVYQFGWLDSIAAPGASTGATSSSNVGSYAITANVGTTLTSALGVTYRVVKNTGTLTVTPAPLTVTATSVQKTYGQTVVNGSTGYSVSGLVNGDSVTSVSFNSSGLAANAAVDGGPYAITPSNALGTGLSNYTITYANGALTITPATLTYTANSASMTYGSTVPALSGTLTGFVNGDTLNSATTGTLAFTTNATSTSNAGRYVINGSGLTANHGNYIFTQAAANTNAFSVTPAPITVTANGGSSVYGSSSTNPGLSATGLKNGQDVSVLTGLSNSFGIDRQTNAGTYALAVNGTLTNPNYSISGTTPGTWTVTPAALIITASNQSKTYGDTLTFTGSEFSSTGLQNGESIGLVTLTSSGQAATADVAGGPYTITASGATGGTFNIANYNVLYNDGRLTVSPAPIFVSALGGSSVYGSSSTNPGLSATGLKNGQDVSVLAGLSNSFGIDRQTNAGTYTLAVDGTLANPNYSISGTTPGTWTVTPAALIITASNQSKTYGDTLTFTGSEFSSTGLQNGESIGLVTLTSSGQAATADVAGGPYTITASGATGGTFNIANYSVLYNDGRLTVTPAPIFVSALGGSSVYGSSSTNPGLSATGLKNCQDVSVLAGLSNSFGIDRQTNAGTYTLAVDGTLANPNYSISGTTPGTWTVTPAPITVTANGGTSVYGSVSSDPGLSATGLRNGQDVSVLTGLSNSFGIDPTTNVAGSPYTLSVLGTLTNANYAITTRNTGTWTVTPAPITVTANSGTSVYGSASSDPGLSATGLRNGQDVSVLTGLSNSFGIDPTTNVAGSPYTLSVLGTLTNANYAITTRNTGTWTVTPAPITVTANSGTSVYGSASSDPGLSATGLRNGQDVSVLTGLSNSFGIDPNTNVAGSPYTLSVLGTLTNANYAITTRNTGTWTVTPAPITVTANSGTSIYGSVSSDPGLSATGLRNGQDVSVLTGLSNSFGINPTTNVAGSPYTLSVLGTLTNANYAITTRNTGTWTVTPAPLTITANNQSKTYGDTRAFAGSEFSSTGLKNDESVGLVTLISDGQTAAATVAGGPYPIVVSGATGGTFNITNYNVTYVNGSLTVIPAGIIVTAIGGSSTYGTSPANPGLSATGLRNGEDVSVLSGLSNSFGIDRFSHAGSHPLAVLGTLANPNYVISGREMGIWVVDPAQLTYVANSAKRYYGDSNPPFSGMVTGFVNGETLATATTGTLDFTSPATKDSILGTYAINGSGLNAANYIFVQAPENATALVITAPPTMAASQFGPPVNNPPPTTVNITFESPGSGSEPAWVSFAPRIATSADGDIPTASLPRNADLGSNNGYAFPPISEFDPTQYTQLKLPDYAAQASQATVFTMIARAALSKQAANIMIDTFWNETAPDLNGATGNNPVAGRVTFSDGAGHGVTPGVGNAFTIEPGKTSFTELLRSGPVMIGGTSGHTPAQWLLATGLSPDGKSILCNDPVTGRVVALSLDSATGAIGPIVGFYDLKSKGIAQLADNSGTLPADSSIEAIKDFVPSTFFAVKIQ